MRMNSSMIDYLDVSIEDNYYSARVFIDSAAAAISMATFVFLAQALSAMISVYKPSTDQS